ncbi:MAG: LamG-like jellyroll fold domain-containing protein, partial [Phycisphaerales bacterium]
MMPMPAAAFGKAGSVYVPPAEDPYWDHVAFLLRGEGADGSTVFTDLSQYGRAVTPVGAAQNDTDIVVGTSPSIKFDSDANYVYRAHGYEVNIGSANHDFCFECYAYFTTLTGVINDIYGRRRNDGNYKLYTSGADLIFATFNSTTQTTKLSVAHGMAINTVYHIAVVRVGTTYYGFVDGVLKGSSTNSTAMSADTTALYIGQSESDQPTRFMRGNLNWLRITMGKARYNVAGFTPPSLPLPTGRPAPVATPSVSSFANVAMLLGFNGTDGDVTTTDESSFGRAMTFVGNAQIDTAQAKFGASSLLLDGTGDYLTTPSTTDIQIGATGTSAFCMEAWVRISSIKSGFACIMSKRSSGGSGEYTLWLNSGKASFIAQISGSNSVALEDRTAISLNEWHHIAISQAGPLFRMFVDG